ncbi:flagellar basal-body MS-ring/collar protein FliF [Kordiimonas sp. SCSIO 12610]|uniref:flagellar basal-body MS-ring/collar protein FliF n=1 Tax=Kordiimonas sp. SCSIO 12610 TaxID=2829597 RepID=UPI00210D8CE2|nr:flagellar basal-body MS-ring/collar protein FliF [Kordiimonas sp. SCSIO 12610]UTW54534.1 flagellar M-ring protein FliF [Kordiimonas sp. SCSIO 12610]
MDGLIQAFKNFGAARLIAFAGAILATVFVFSLIIGRIGQPPMRVLFSGLAPQDAASIIQALETQNIPHELDGAGSIIKVPDDQVDRLRITLASDGLAGGIVGKEIFDQDSSFGRTSFELNVNLVRAIEGELSRTIRNIQSVSEARVHVVLPERRPFQRDASEPSASILVRTVGGGLGARQVQAIQSLVASAVPGLTPDNVTISDTAGRLLSDGASEPQLGSFTSFEEARVNKERLYREKIEDLLSRYVGEGNVRAEVSIDINLNRTTRNQVTYDPDGQVVVSQNTSENTSRDETSTPTPDTATVANNLPDAQQSSNTSVNTSSDTNEVTNFENSKTETITVVEPGEIQQLRISVLVNSNALTPSTDADTDGAQQTQDTPIDTATLEELVKAAVPYDEARDDQITVRALAFAPVEELEAPEEPFNILGAGINQLVSIGTNIGLFILGVMFLLMIVRPVVMKLIETIPTPSEEPEPAQIENQAAETPALFAPDSPVTADVVAAAAAGDESAAAIVRAAKNSGSLALENFGVDSKIDVAQVEGRLQESAVKKVADIIKSHPDESVAILRNWLYAE